MLQKRKQSGYSRTYLKFIRYPIPTITDVKKTNENIFNFVGSTSGNGSGERTTLKACECLNMETAL